MSQAHLSDENLIGLLKSDEVSSSLLNFAEHVDHCQQCRSRLEELAAAPQQWVAARESLLSLESDKAIAHGADNRRCWWLRPSTDWNESMSRQLLSPPSHPEMLGRLGRYEVERLLGSGGMGIVFKAFDSELNRPVAIKVLSPYLSGSGAARARFAREARAAAAVVHEHVVAIHNVESEGVSPFLVMPYIPGESLQQRIDRVGPLELCEILRLAMQTAAGLAAAHAQGLVHRDVKPSNILLENGVERALLTDFGLARASDDASLTHTGYHPGTPQYMSPEQARGDNVDARSDLFSLGSVIYAMGTGRPPFRADTNYGVLRRITDNEPRPMIEINPNVPKWLDRIVGKLLAKSPAHRFQSAEELAVLLEQCLAYVQQPTMARLPKQCWEFSRESNTSLHLWSKFLKLLTGSKIWAHSTLAFVLVCATLTAMFLALGINGLLNLVSPLNSAQTNSSSTKSSETISGTENQDLDSLTTNSSALVQLENNARPSEAALSNVATETDWGSLDAELDSYLIDVIPFEARAGRLWDDLTTQNKE
ncbi:MAG: serine/threonine protein kinase [Planctomycetales bacterium]|nr:serine/threonine protein kinase [Planctomycetales bacterium]